MIQYEEFAQLDVRIGKILSATKVEGTDKLIKVEVDLGVQKRQIVAAMAKFFDPEFLVGKEMPILVNLAPRKFKGIESQGMILAADVDGKPVLLHPEREVPPGTIVR
ncbi:methionine--tRNA ligase [Candidatus Sumerlaeota bacterium]|nr:methionine--tRNA ligase [Candidatus Sumerlaeota bacterium]